MTDNRNPAAIQTMFDRISPRYDLLNRILSFGVDIRWRKHAVEILGDLRGKTALDLCCGSGDFAAILLRKYHDDIKVIGADFSVMMLKIANKRFERTNHPSLLFCQSDALNLPLANSSVDAVTIGFGIRNIADKESALAEISRVLKAGGRLAIVEPAMPDNRFLRLLFTFYFRHVMPLVGGIISGQHTAYRYLYDSVSTFPRPDEFVAMMQHAGFADVKALPRIIRVRDDLLWGEMT